MAGMTKAVDALCIKVATVAGTTATTNIAVTGIATEDILVSVVEIATTTGIPTDRTGEASITSAGNIQLASTDTSSDKLIVHWHDASA